MRNFRGGVEKFSGGGGVEKFWRGGGGEKLFFGGGVEKFSGAGVETFSTGYLTAYVVDFFERGWEFFGRG